jgi:release factor glutamine methyltransferase
VVTPGLDAEVLLANAMGVDRAVLYARPEATLPVSVRDAFTTAARRRALREPVAYITGVREFWSLPFFVNRTVLIPRPETELLVETVCRTLKPQPGGSVPQRAGRVRSATPPSPLVCDVGTGSGCIAVSVAHELPDAHVVAGDLSPAALEVARHNARANGVESRITFVHSDLFAGIDAETRFDVIASNPPYVPECARLDPELAWEPQLAVRAGPRGLEVAQELLRQAPARLRPGGLLVMEIGQGQAEAVADLARNAGFVTVDILPDLAGIPRVLLARDVQARTRDAGSRVQHVVSVGGR